MKFSAPDWDDRVDPGFDFISDRPSLTSADGRRSRDPYRDDRYAHELMSDRVYDGILVSRMALEGAGPKRTLVEKIGMRRYLRMPKPYQLFGDCGAFGYLREQDPRFSTDDVLQYYDRLDFDYGVSVDHLIVPEFAAQRQYRYDLTLHNAHQFLKLHRRRGYSFTPIGAVQGWDLESYVNAAQEVVAMGYDYIALGGLARANTKTIAATVVSVASALPKTIRIHVFGVARLTLLDLFLKLGIASVDSAAPLRQAWLSTFDNYYVLDGTYAAIRIPTAAEQRPSSRNIVTREDVSLPALQAAERAALRALREHDSRPRVKSTLEAIMAYDQLLTPREDGLSSKRRADLYQRTLTDRPWKHCPCNICRDLGVEVIIFRGNNRNRRRGFHNLWVVRQRITTLNARSAKASSLRASIRTPSPSQLPFVTLN